METPGKPLLEVTFEIDPDDASRTEADVALREVNRRAALDEAARYVLASELNVPDETTWFAWRKARGLPGT